MVKKTIEIDVVAPNAQQNINSITTSLNNASKSSDDLNKTLNTDKGSGKFTGLKDAVGKIVPAFDTASEGASAFNKQLLVLLANPIGLVIAGIVLAIAGLVSIFKSFTPVVDKVEQGLSALSAVVTTIKNTFIAVVTGTKSLTDAFSGLGGSMSEAANEAIRLTKAQQDLDDALQAQDITVSKLDSQINKLNVQARNRNLTEAESLALLKKSEDLQNQKLNLLIKNADKEVLLARDRIANAANLTKEERKQLKEQGFAYKEFVEGRTTDVDELFEALKNAQIKRNNIEDQATAQLEKNQNKQDAIAEKEKARRDKAIEDEKARRDKAIADEKKRLDDLAEAQKKYNDEFLAFQVTVSNAGIEQNLLEKQLAEESLQIQSDLIAKEEAIRQQAEDKEREEAKKTAEEKKILREQELQAASDTFGILADLLGKQSKAGKAFAVAQALINTYQGITAGVKLGYPQAIPAVLAASVTGFKAVKDILKTDPKSSGASSASSSSGGGVPTATPQFNLVGQSSTNQLSQTIANQQKQPIKTYVVAGDVTTQQGLDRNAVQTSTFGG